MPNSKPETSGTTRLLTRFLRLLLPVFLLASSLGLYVLGAFTFGDERANIAMRIGNLTARTANAINKIPDNLGNHQRNAVLSLLLADPAVACAVIVDENKNVLAAAPARIGCRGAETAAQAEVKLQSPAGSSLCVKYNLTELEDRGQLFRIFTLMALLGSLVVAAAASWFSFRVTVGKPVNALLSAIRTTHLLGRPTKVALVPDDELGSVIHAFNDMQDKLEGESRRNTEALRRLDYIYNETPALMFSIDADGVIVHASGHWLDETGYRREDIVGAPLQQFLTVSPGEDFPTVKRTIVEAARPLRDIPFTLTCKNGDRKDVLMAVVPDIEADHVAKLCVLSDISGLKNAQVELRRQAVTDHLTGLPNRQGLFEHLSSIKRTTPSEVEGCALLFIDLDNFKTVNDTLGHAAGDQLLKAAAGRLRNCISRKDSLARLGGDEFAVVLHGLRQPNDATIVADRIIKSFINPFRIGEASALVGTSIGIAHFSESENNDDILRLADLAMYQSKQSGKNCVSSYSSDLTAKVVSRDIMVRKIRDALTEDRFVFHFQPIVDLGTMRPVGMEALLRLNCPNDGLMAPYEIIKAAEETGLIGRITSWGVAEGLSVAQDHLDRLADRGRYISINLSPKQITFEFMSELISRLRANPRVAKSMVFEITETALFRQDEDVSGMLAELRATGARIALDDFGTGYSSLGHIHRFPVDIIKLDRSFVSGLGHDSEDSRRRRALIKATAALANELNMAIIAEGIEDNESLGVILELGIRYGQGYLFSTPMPGSVALDWLDTFDSESASETNVVRLNRMK